VPILSEENLACQEVECKSLKYEEQYSVLLTQLPVKTLERFQRGCTLLGKIMCQGTTSQVAEKVLVCEALYQGTTFSRAVSR